MTDASCVEYQLSPAFITLGGNKQANQLIAGGYQA